MFINKKHYDALMQAHKGEKNALNKTIAAKDFAIEQLQKEIANLEARIEYNKQRAAKRLEATAEKKLRKPYHKPAIKAEDNREELRNDNRDEDNHYHKMPEE